MMPKILILMIALGCMLSRLPAAAAPQTVEQLVKQALEAERRMQPSDALVLFKQAAELKPNDAYLLQHISRQYSDCTVNEPSNDKRRELTEKALTYSQKAYALEPKNPVNVLSLAICYGKLGLYGDAKTRVENARLVRKFADEALALKPDYDWAHHVLGRWHFEVTELGGTKRLFVSMFYGGLPKASYAEAVIHLEKSVELAPTVVSHHVELGFALRAVGRNDEARKHFEKGLQLTSLDIHDEACKERARTALAGTPRS